MSFIRTAALCWLTFLFAFALGMFVSYTKIWPYGPLREIKHFIEGDVWENVSILKKLANDTGLKPSRHIRSAKLKIGTSIELEDCYDPEKHRELGNLSLRQRRNSPKVFISDDAPKGYRFIYGTFDFKEGLHGAILLDSEAEVMNTWQISQDDVEWAERRDTNIFPHGVEISPDGSIVTAYDGGSTLTKYDYCGNVVWRIEGEFHHSIAFENGNAIWTWRRKSLVKVSYETGEVLKEISLWDVMDANEDIDIFGILQNVTREGSPWLDVAGGIWHANDIDPLPQKLVHLYPGFRAGDLLVSMRSPNLIFVLDQETLKVKWWRQGLVRRQHDPDWNEVGTITIFNNNMHRGYSSIVEINPSTYEHRTIVEGGDYNFYTWWRGKHQVTGEGTVLITSSDQGRAFEVNEQGDIVFEFLNQYSDDHEHMVISEARFLPEIFFKELPQCE